MFTTSLHIATIMEIEETLAPPVAGLVRLLDRAAMPYLAQRLRIALARIDEAEGGLHEILSGGEHDCAGMSELDWRAMAASVARETGRPFVLAPGGYADHVSLDAVVAAMAAVRGVVVTLLDTTDPRGSVRPERFSAGQAPLEAMSMVCIHVMGLDQIVTAAGSRGNHPPRALRPVIAMSVLSAIRTVGPACSSIGRIIPSLSRRAGTT
jgi:fumarate hydratase class II